MRHQGAGVVARRAGRGSPLTRAAWCGWGRRPPSGRGARSEQGRRTRIITYKPTMRAVPGALLLALLSPLPSAAAPPAPPPSLYLGPCNATDTRMQWTGAALSTPGAASAIENVGAKQCLSTLGKAGRGPGHRLPTARLGKGQAVLEPCGGKAATCEPPHGHSIMPGCCTRRWCVLCCVCCCGAVMPAY